MEFGEKKGMTKEFNFFSCEVQCNPLSLPKKYLANSAAEVELASFSLNIIMF